MTFGCGLQTHTGESRNGFEPLISLINTDYPQTNSSINYTWVRITRGLAPAWVWLSTPLRFVYRKESLPPDSTWDGLPPELALDLSWPHTWVGNRIPEKKLRCRSTDLGLQLNIPELGGATLADDCGVSGARWRRRSPALCWAQRAHDVGRPALSWSV
jgi:hypothetical protein